MRVTIKGLTDSTIQFNTIGIVLRGNSAKPTLYPNSIARHIDIKTDDQMRELITLKNAKLVEVIDEALQDTPSQKLVQTTQSPKINTQAPKIVIKPLEPTYQDKVKSNDYFETLPVEDIEDAPSKTKPSVDVKVIQPEPIEVEEDPEAILTVSKKVGRPKKTNAVKETKANKKPTTKAKPIKKLANVIKEAEVDAAVAKMNAEEGDSKIVVMTPGGAMEGKAVNNMAGEIPESDATKASIDALKKMEDEEQAMEDTPVDESKFAINEQMGGSAVIATGEATSIKVAMTNSILPEADAIKKRGIKWISPDGEDNDAFIDAVDTETEVVDSNKLTNMFLDNDDHGTESDDAFIET